MVYEKNMRITVWVIADGKIGWCLGQYYSSIFIRYCTFKISYHKKAAYVFFIIFLISVFSCCFIDFIIFYSGLCWRFIAAEICKYFVLDHFLSFMLINDLFSLPLPTAHIYVTKFFQIEMRLTTLGECLISCLLFIN